MQSIMLRKLFDQEKAKLEFIKEIDSLKKKLLVLELEMKEKDRQKDEMGKVIKFFIINFFSVMKLWENFFFSEASESEFQIYEKKIKNEAYKFEEEIKKRDKAINALAKALDKKEKINSALHPVLTIPFIFYVLFLQSIFLYV